MAAPTTQPDLDLLEKPTEALLQAALAGDDARAIAIIRRWPDSPSYFPCTLATAGLRAFDHLAPSTANRRIGPHAWPPLLYLCNSRFQARDKVAETVRLRLGAALIELGADPNAGTRESQTIRGYRTALGGAVGRVRSPALAKLLIDAGADVADGPTLYEGSAMWEAVRLHDIECLKVLLAAAPPQWQVCHALPQSLVFNDLGLVRLLLDHDAQPNWTMGAWGFKGNCLHEAVVLDNDPAIVNALLAKGAQVDFKDRGGRTPLAVATCLGRDTHAALLRKHGANNDEIRDVDRWVSACFAGDADRARQAASRDPDHAEAAKTCYGATASPEDRRVARAILASKLEPIDHLWLCRAIRAGNDLAAPLLLAGGADPDVADDDGNRALHLAAAAGNEFVVDCLIAAGADAQGVNYAGETPLDTAERSTAPTRSRVTAKLAPYRAEEPSVLYDEPDFADTFEHAADAVVQGDIATLEALLRDHPKLATARSARPHRCTLLHYLGANGFETQRQKTPGNAVEVIETLLAAGADPNASCYTYRGGPGELTVGLLTSSGHPRDAGLTVSMVTALAKGGARVDDVYRLLAELADRPAGEVTGFDPASDVAAAALIECAMLRERRILFALLDAGVDVNVRRGDGATALHQAAIDGDSGLVEALLARGADLSLRDNVYDGTAAGWAYAGEHEALGKALSDRLAAAEPRPP